MGHGKLNLGRGFFRFPPSQIQFAVSPFSKPLIFLRTAIII